jgi:hypothetical protein
MGDEKFINEHYGENFHSHLLEQYKLFVHTSLEVTSKRLEANKFHLTLNSVIFAIASYLTVVNTNAIIILFSAVGILISFVWRRSIDSYKELNKAKFKVIHELEAYLPARLFKWEEKHYLAKYHGLTSAEKYYPIIFIILYSAVIAINLFLLINAKSVPVAQIVSCSHCFSLYPRPF